MRTPDPELQPSLFGITELPAIHELTKEEKSSLSIDEQFQRFHELNPHVCDAIIAVSHHARTKWHLRKWSVDAAFHALRWEYAFKTGGDDFKLNNNYTAPYSRLVLERDPSLRGFFEQRKRRASDNN